MTNEELKKKIAQIIADYFCSQRNEHKNLWGDNRLCYSKMNFAECERVAKCVDALIAAGIGDVSELKKHRVVVEKSLIPEDDNAYVLPNISPTVKQLYSGEEVEQIVKEREEYKHRAEVAERALDLCETAYILSLNHRATEGVSGRAIASDLGIHKFFMEQAENELAEERKDE